ncbi:hypothetical protein ABQ366_05255 [Serratia fonticola]|uniref:hypothetical protein n=1 Tax=Serratia fonticola TaxID=47917 RepID=UPI003AACAD5A
MEKIIFNVQNNPDITIVGREVAYVHEQVNDVTYRIYETQKGSWFFAALSNQNMLLKYEVIENKSADKLVEILGHSDLAKSLYTQLDIETAQNLDI